MRHPSAVFVQLNTNCNASCVNCPHPFTYGAKGSHTKGVMSDATWNKIVKDIVDMDYRGQVGLYLHFEPLLERSLFSKIRQINTETRAYVVFSTNGSLLSDENRRELIAAQPRQVHINIDSADKTQYENMMGLPFERTMERAKNFIKEANGKVRVEINCPVMPGVDTSKLVEMFAGTQVNTEYWANSRGGLLDGISSKDCGSRFKINQYCLQPEQNFNILHDGRVIVCCNDWAHESKKDFPNISDSSILEIYNGRKMGKIIQEFRNSNYGRYKMCEQCAVEMGFTQQII